MTESLLLVLFGVLILVIIYLVRRVVTQRKMAPWPTQTEAIFRVGLCLLFAFIAHAYFNPKSDWGASFAIAVLASTLMVYAVTHLFDRLILR